MSNERTVVKKVTNAVLFSDGSIRVDNVRFSYPHIAEPQEQKGDDGSTKLQYSVDGMMPKETHREAKDLIKFAIEELLKTNDTKVGTSFWFLRDGDKLAEEDDKKEQYKGFFIIKTAEKRRPSVRKRNNESMTDKEIADEIYGGMWGSILLRPWYFNGKAKNGKSYPKRVLSNLLAVQKLRDDEPFGQGRISDEGVFESHDGDSGDDGLNSSSTYDDI